MSRKSYRYFAGMLTAQENWLNKMAAKGYRLVHTDKLLYEFEECKPGQFQYCIEFVGDKSREHSQDYRTFLEDLGYKVFYKNINLNYSIGKLRYRPWGEKDGHIATGGTTFNRELLIVEKENDGKPFNLHTSFDDKMKYCKSLRNPWLCIVILFAILGIIYRSLLWGAFAVPSLIPVIMYQLQIVRIGKEGKTMEW